ncbi:DUF2637 domain-containing protein [Catellatospora paridis]|uniref:DUF2637 domain-containing protein n=1 Tax=Catellatospora paridis TaxID=1617086 RepID=UPI0012D3961D|nr:DUF2637 domain-containing protein [Catellatospora paridis]
MNRAASLRALSVALSVLAGVVVIVGFCAVVGAGFALSYDALKAVAIGAHMRPDLAWLFPVTVDGAMAVATIVAIVMKKMEKSTWYPWTVVIVGAVISVICNGLHATTAGGDEVAMAVSAVPPLLLALCVHLLMSLVESIGVSVAEAAEEAAKPAQVRKPARPKPQSATSTPEEVGGVTGAAEDAGDGDLHGAEVQQVKKGRRRKHTEGAEKKTWVSAELLAAVKELEESEPGLTRKQQGERLDVSDRRIRQVLREPVAA